LVSHQPETNRNFRLHSPKAAFSLCHIFVLSLLSVKSLQAHHCQTITTQN